MVAAARQQAITWANIDPVFCRHVASLGPNEWKVLPNWGENLSKIKVIKLKHIESNVSFP